MVGGSASGLVLELEAGASQSAFPGSSPGTSAGRFQPVSSWNEVKRVSTDVGNDKT